MVLPVRTVCSCVCCTIELFFLERQKIFTISVNSILKYLHLLNRLALLISRHWLLMSLLVLRYDTDMDIPLRTKWNNIFEIGKSFWHYIACDIIWVWKSRCVYTFWLDTHEETFAFFHLLSGFYESWTLTWFFCGLAQSTAVESC